MKKNIIIMSFDHKNNPIKIIDGSVTKEYKKMCLGHEIHMTRYVLIDMLLQNRISQDDIIVTLKDRMFLYTLIFKTVIEPNTLANINKNNYNIINLSLITSSDMSVNYNSILQQFNHKTLEKFYTPDFKRLLNSIEYCKTLYDEKYDKDYVVIHHRYNNKIDELHTIIKKINGLINVNIIIFNNNIPLLKNELKYDNLIFTDNLQMYASYLNCYESKYNCKLFISEASGGGQLSHYCYNGKVIYYFEEYANYASQHIGKETYYRENAMKTDMYQHWDFKYSTDIEIKLVKSITDIADIIKHYIT
jgi:hypothetical protein